MGPSLSSLKEIKVFVRLKDDSFHPQIPTTKVKSISSGSGPVHRVPVLYNVCWIHILSKRKV